MGLSERQAKRLHACFKAEGDGGLVRRLRGRAANRRSDPAVRQRSLELHRERYDDFGLTLASEYLVANHGLAGQAGDAAAMAGGGGAVTASLAAFGQASASGASAVLRRAGAVRRLAARRV